MILFDERDKNSPIIALTILYPNHVFNFYQYDGDPDEQKHSNNQNISQNRIKKTYTFGKLKNNSIIHHIIYIDIGNFKYLEPKK